MKGRGNYEVQKMDDSRCRTGIFVYREAGLRGSGDRGGGWCPGTEGTQTAGEQQAQETVTQAPGQTAESGVSQAPAQTAENPAQNEAAAVQSPTVVSGQGQNAPGSTGSDSGAPTSNGEVTGIPEGRAVSRVSRWTR